MKLAQGIDKFKTNIFPQMRENFAGLEAGQSPETLFITCSDSRIDPNLLTQTAPGELFVIRNAGNIVPRPGCGELSVEATIQYAVDVLKVRDIVVCGHSHCGAVAGLLDQESLESMPIVRQWVNHSKKVLEQVSCSTTEIPRAVAANVMLQLDHLREHECVRKAMKEDRLSLHGWVYHFEHGDVEFLTAQSGTLA